VYRAVLDTCALVPGRQRDFLLQLAAVEAYAPLCDDGRAGFETAAVLVDAGIEIVHPQDFAENTVAAHPDAGVRALVAMSRRMATPPQIPEQILFELQDRYGMAEVAALLCPRLPEAP
jgi:hypothetical protein